MVKPMDAEIQAKCASLPALRKSYPGCAAPSKLGSAGSLMYQHLQFNLLKQPIPQFFNFIGSNAENVPVTIGAPIMPFAVSEIKEKSPPSSIPEPPSKSG